jgi:hypothetical protein
MAFLIAVFCAAMVWWLERFEREKLASTWTEFIDNWHKKTEGEPT